MNNGHQFGIDAFGNIAKRIRLRHAIPELPTQRDHQVTERASQIGDQMTQIRQVQPFSTAYPLLELTCPVPAVSQKLAGPGRDDGFCLAQRAPRSAVTESPAGHLRAETV